MTYDVIFSMLGKRKENVRLARATAFWVLLAVAACLFLPRGSDAATIAHARGVQVRPIAPPEPAGIRVVVDPSIDALGYAERLGSEHGGDTIVVQNYSPEPGTVAHELGHFFDMRYLSDTDRAAFLALTGLPADLPWWAPTGYEQGSEYFAECMRLLWTKRVIDPRWHYSTGPRLLTGRVILAVGRWLAGDF